MRGTPREPAVQSALRRSMKTLRIASLIKFAGKINPGYKWRARQARSDVAPQKAGQRKAARFTARLGSLTSGYQCQDINVSTVSLLSGRRFSIPS